MREQIRKIKSMQTERIFLKLEVNSKKPHLNNLKTTYWIWHFHGYLKNIGNIFLDARDCFEEDIADIKLAIELLNEVVSCVQKYDPDLNELLLDENILEKPIKVSDRK